MTVPPIRLAHSPDSDDAFMFYALAAGRIDTGNRLYEHDLRDIETLNIYHELVEEKGLDPQALNIFKPLSYSCCVSS